jgi:hypothetical protein
MPRGTEGAIDVKGLDKALRSITEMEPRARDILRVGGAVKSVYLTSNERHWQSPSWPRLADSTIERKQRQGQDARPERKSGALYRSLTADRARGVIDERKPQSLRFGTKLFYARWQNSGTLFQPARDLIELSWIERQMITRIVGRYIAKGDVAHGETLT